MHARKPAVEQLSAEELVYILHETRTWRVSSPVQQLHEFLQKFSELSMVNQSARTLNPFISTMANPIEEAIALQSYAMQVSDDKLRLRTRCFYPNAWRYVFSQKTIGNGGICFASCVHDFHRSDGN